MGWSKKGALGMLVTVVLWISSPLLACLPDLASQAKTDCCAAMMQDCGAMMGSTCCQLAPTRTPATTVRAYAPEHQRSIAALLRGQTLPGLSEAPARQSAFFATAPPDPSPGGHSVLRI